MLDRRDAGDDCGYFSEGIIPGRQPVHPGVWIKPLHQKVRMPDRGIDEQNGLVIFHDGARPFFVKLWEMLALTSCCTGCGLLAAAVGGAFMAVGI